MQPLGSVAAVAAAIREDAAAEAERITREAAARLPLAVAGPALPAVEREARLAAARREAREKLAAEDALDTRSALEAREAWMTEVIAWAKQHLDEEDRGARLKRLVLEASLPAPLTLTVAPVDQPLLEGALVDPAMTPGGLRIASGRLSVDETVESRARRLEAKWRAALGRIWG